MNEWFMSMNGNHLVYEDREPFSYRLIFSRPSRNNPHEIQQQFYKDFFICKTKMLALKILVIRRSARKFNKASKVFMRNLALIEAPNMGHFIARILSATSYRQLSWKEPVFAGRNWLEMLSYICLLLRFFRGRLQFFFFATSRGNTLPFT